MRAAPLLSAGQGVRQAVWTLYKNASVPGFHIARKVEHAHEIMRISIFCLAPSGYGWGMRIVEAILNGCIPVVCQARWR